MLKLSQQCLIKACDELGIQYEVLHKNQIIVKVLLDPPLFFIHHYKAIDREDVSKICKDKDITYTLLKGKINIPKWKAYLDPECPEEYRDYLFHKSQQEIVRDITTNFDYPVVVKMNSGSQGINVYVCKNEYQIKEAVEKIFNKQNKNYDYILLAQEFINIKKEYRVLVYKRKILFAYEKNIDNAVFNGNVSPLHWENSKAILVEDQSLLNSFTQFMQPVFNEIGIKFAGLDIAIDNNDDLILIEVNKSPGIARFAKDNGTEKIVEMYKTILSDLRLQEV